VVIYTLPTITAESTSQGAPGQKFLPSPKVNPASHHLVSSAVAKPQLSRCQVVQSTCVVLGQGLLLFLPLCVFYILMNLFISCAPGAHPSCLPTCCSPPVQLSPIKGFIAQPLIIYLPPISQASPLPVLPQFPLQWIQFNLLTLVCVLLLDPLNSHWL